MGSAVIFATSTRDPDVTTHEPWSSEYPSVIIS